MGMWSCNQLVKAGLLVSTMFVAPHLAQAQLDTAIAGNNGTLPLPNGQFVTPVAPLTNAVQQFLNPGLSTANNPNYANFVAGEAVRSQLSPDGATLAIICAGQNSLFTSAGAADYANSTQYIFLYNVAGANKTNPVLQQVIQQNNAHVGLVWSPDGNTLYSTGGNDDAVYMYTKSGGSFVQTAKVALGHVPASSTASLTSTRVNGGIGIGVQPNASGLGLSVDGSTLVVANNFNDSISVINTAGQNVRYEYDLRPYNTTPATGNGVPGGEYPFAVAVKSTTGGAPSVAYVSSVRDREIVVVDISGSTPSLIKRIPLNGSPYGLTLNASQSTLFVAEDNADQVVAIDTTSNSVTHTVDARAPAGILTGPDYTGAAPFAVTLSPDGNTLYSVNNGSNSIAVIPLTGANTYTVTGLIPTAYAPKDITFSQDGTWMYIINGKSDQGANPGHLYGSSGPNGNTRLLTTVTYPGGNPAAANAATATNEYQFQLEHSTLVSARVPAAGDLSSLTSQVAQNNFYNVPPVASDTAVMNFLHAHVQHVIYIVKENRTFDQMLGDLANGSNGDPTLTVFGKRITPNFHRLAANFVTLDNFMDAADGSMDGWSLATQGRVTSTEELSQQINYAFPNRGVAYESEGDNRNVPIGVPTTAGRDAATNGGFSAGSTALAGGTANLFPGPADIAASDAPFGIQKGYIFDAVLQAGGTVRNYGFLGNNIGAVTVPAGTPVTNPAPGGTPISDPFTAGVVQCAPIHPSLIPLTDPYFRCYDQNYPDVWRYNEWKREFDQYVAGNNLPSLETVRVSHDHTGSFGTALAAVNTPETQQADDDLSVGRLVEAVAHSPYASNTVIIVTEDDSQDGPDHIDSHRTTTYVVGPYVKQNAVVSTRYNQVSVLRTIEDILGTPHINLNTAYQRPMADVFDITSAGAWTYSATASTILKTTMLSQAEIGVKYAEGPDVRSTHDAAYWAKATRGFDFSDADRVPAELYNEVLWQGLMGSVPYPTHRSGLQLGLKLVTGQ